MDWRTWVRQPLQSQPKVRIARFPILSELISGSEDWLSSRSIPGLAEILLLGSMLKFGEIGVLALAGFTAKSIKVKEPEHPSKVSRFLFIIIFQQTSRILV